VSGKRKQRSLDDQEERAAMSLVIRGMGTALPRHSIGQDEAAQVARVLCCRNEEDVDLLPDLYRHTGIDRRHMIFAPDVVQDILQGECSSGSIFLPSGLPDDRGPTTHQRMECYGSESQPLALRAGRLALRHAHLEPEGVTHLVTVSCTGFGAPGLDIGLIKGLHLPPSVERVHVGFMGCHGALNGLRVALAFASQPGACVLLCAVELCSLHYHYGWDPKKMVSNALFADGAAALVGVSTRVAGDAWRATATGSYLFPDTEYAMTWSIGDHGFEMTLSTRVPSLIAAHLRPWLIQWLDEQGLPLGDVASWAVHPGGPRILSAVEEGLSLPSSALAVSREVLAECGNMSSPTVLFILDRLRQRQAPRPCVALGFGPGLVVEAALFR
jgi:predicted naringenin-chalcone synthase